MSLGVQCQAALADCNAMLTEQAAWTSCLNKLLFFWCWRDCPFRWRGAFCRLADWNWHSHTYSVLPAFWKTAPQRKQAWWQWRQSCLKLLPWTHSRLQQAWQMAFMKSMKLVIPLDFISWVNSFSDISRMCILPNMTPESIHTKDESKRGFAFAFVFGVNWPVQWVQSSFVA